MEILKGLAEWYLAGQWGMHLILGTSIFVFSIIIERVWYVMVKSSIKAEQFTLEVIKHIKKRDINGAINVCNRFNTPLTRIVKSVLQAFAEGEEDLQSVADEVSLVEIPKLDKRTPYLSMLGNVSVLFGLLGTISGLIRCFGSLAGVSAAEKTAILSMGISEAMHCTAFGLFVAITAIIFHGIISGRTSKIMSDIDSSAVKILNTLEEVRR
jgi:biopolymer transport protein ExbB/TolQ